MKSRILCVLLALLSGGMLAAWEVEDLNGTYVYSEELLLSPDVPEDYVGPYVHEKNYSWGKGISITETSIDFDLGKKIVMIPGLGRYNIEKVYKEGEDTVCLEIHYYSEIFNMRFTFIDYDRVYITHDNWTRFQNRRYSPESKWIWYRLSGPKGA